MPKDAQPILRETAQSTFKGRIDWRFTTEWKSSEAGIRRDVRFTAANGNAPPAAVDPSRVTAISTEGPFPQALRENSWLKCPPGSQICCGVRAAGGQSLAVARISWLSGDPSKPDAGGLSDFLPGYAGLGIADPPAVYRPRRPEKTAFYRVFQDHFDNYVRAHEQRFEPRSGPPAARRRALGRRVPFLWPPGTRELS